MRSRLGAARYGNNRPDGRVYSRAGLEPARSWREASAGASLVRERTPSLRYTFERFHLTVFGLMTSSAAISTFVRPAAARSGICASVSVNRPGLGALRPPIRPSSDRAFAAQSG